MIKPEILKLFRNSQVLVTGGTGLIGRQVTDILCQAGARVTVVSLDRLNVNPQAEHVRGDLTHLDFCLNITQGRDFVFHLAGIKASVEAAKTKPASHFVPTLMFNTNVLETCRINKVKKLVYTSSIGAYSNAEIFKETDQEDFGGPPMDFAGWAKRMGELQIRAYGIQYGMENFAIVRPCNVYGPGDNFDPDNAMVIPSLLYRVHRGENPLVVWGDGSAIRDFAFARDVAEGVILALVHGTRGSYVNLGSGQGHSIRELVETLRRFIQFDYVFDATKPSGFPRRVMDISRARDWLGYCPSTSLEAGLKETWAWFLQNQDEFRQKINYFQVVPSPL